jgi:hypothetical protein
MSRVAVFIGGRNGSGKTSISNEIRKRIDNCTIINKPDMGHNYEIVIYEDVSALSLPRIYPNTILVLVSCDESELPFRFIDCHDSDARKKYAKKNKKYEQKYKRFEVNADLVIPNNCRIHKNKGLDMLIDCIRNYNI